MLFEAKWATSTRTRFLIIPVACISACVPACSHCPQPAYLTQIHRAISRRQRTRLAVQLRCPMACYLVKPHGCLWCSQHGVVRGRGSFRQGCGSPWGRAWHGNGRTAAWIGEIKGTREATHRRPLCVLHCMAHVLQAVEYHTVLENITYALKKISFPNCGLQHDSHFVNASMCQYWKLYGWGYSKHLINMVKHYILKLQLMMCNIPLATWWQGCTMTGHSTQIPHPWNLRPGKNEIQTLLTILHISVTISMV